MVALIGGRVRDIRWFADPPRFYEIELDDDGNPRLDAEGVPVRTGNWIKGTAARNLMAELVKDRPLRPDGTQVIGTLPHNWVLDDYWEYGLVHLRDHKGRKVLRGGEPVRMPKGQGGPWRGRRHSPDFVAERAVLVADSVDLVFVAWWKQVYPDIPHRALSRDYFWYKNDGYVAEVLADDADIILKGCVGEFLDVTAGDGIPRNERPIVLAK